MASILAEHKSTPNLKLCEETMIVNHLREKQHRVGSWLKAEKS